MKIVGSSGAGTDDSKKGKSESTHPNKMANSSSDLSSFLPENELVELLWENGQIMMQGQSNRAKRSYGDDAAVVKFGMNGELDSPAASAAAAARELPTSVPSVLNSHEEDADQWLSYAMDDGDSLQNDYCSDFFSTVMTSLSNSNANLNPAEKNTKDSHLFKFSPVASEPSKNRAGHLYSVPQQSQISSENPKSRFQTHDSGVQKPLHKHGGAGLINFSHFSRPASLVKSNPHSINRLHEKSCVESTRIDSVSNSMNMERKESDTAAETVAASSSVCSGQDAGITSNGIVHKSTKRTREREESGEQSDDLEEDSFGVKEPSSGRGANGKRSRAAEVHNLSERRRRDRINEKMKALQELIPNCNKVDKASMLDEAIEYLKTLQLQVQAEYHSHFLSSPNNSSNSSVLRFELIKIIALLADDVDGRRVMHDSDDAATRDEHAAFARPTIAAIFAAGRRNGARNGNGNGIGVRDGNDRPQRLARGHSSSSYAIPLSFVGPRLRLWDLQNANLFLYNSFTWNTCTKASCISSISPFCEFIAGFKHRSLWFSEPAASVLKLGGERKSFPGFT